MFQKSTAQIKYKYTVHYTSYILQADTLQFLYMRLCELADQTANLEWL